MAAGNGGHLWEPGGKLAQGHAALHFRDAMLPCIDPLGVIGLDGGGIDDQLRSLGLLALLPDIYGDAQLLQLSCELGFLPVGAGDLMPLLQQDLGNAAHAASAYADKVDPFYIIQGNCHCVSPPLKFLG